jgi:hypothetical protein
MALAQARATCSVYSPIWAVAMTWRTRNHVRAKRKCWTAQSSGTSHKKAAVPPVAASAARMLDHSAG